MELKILENDSTEVLFHNYKRLSLLVGKNNILVREIWKQIKNRTK